MLRYHTAYYLRKGQDNMVVAEILDFPGVFSQGLDPLPVPNPDASAPGADLVELLPLTVEVGAAKP